MIGYIFISLVFIGLFILVGIFFKYSNTIETTK
jgi:hypothetical protein